MMENFTFYLVASLIGLCVRKLVTLIRYSGFLTGRDIQGSQRGIIFKQYLGVYKHSGSMGYHPTS